MKKIALFLVIYGSLFHLNAQCDSEFSKYNGGSYLSETTTSVALRQGPNSSCPLVSTLKSGSQIFVLSKDGENSYYPVIDIHSNKRGFVSKSSVRLGEFYASSTTPMFNKSGYSRSYDSRIEVFNNTSKTLTLNIGDAEYTFSPAQKRTITVKPGSIYYLASAPGGLPSKGVQKFEKHSSYAWEFYISTSRY